MNQLVGSSVIGSSGGKKAGLPAGHFEGVGRAQKDFLILLALLMAAWSKKEQDTKNRCVLAL